MNETHNNHLSENSISYKQEAFSFQKLIESIYVDFDSEKYSTTSNIRNLLNIATLYSVALDLFNKHSDGNRVPELDAFVVANEPIILELKNNQKVLNIVAQRFSSIKTRIGNNYNINPTSNKEAVNSLNNIFKK